LKQTAVADAASVIVGSAFTVTVKLDVVLVQELAFLTVRFPVYVPAAVLAGTVIVMGLDVSDAFVTAAKLFDGLAFHAML
jgi:hypothetical protein